MAKLEDLLAKYLVEWPDGAEYLEQGLSGALYSQSNSPVGFIKELSEDSIRVTCNQYLAARDRLHNETLKAIATEQPDKTAPNRHLWLEIAKEEFFMMETEYPDLPHEQRAEFAFDAADAFVAEFAKRQSK